MISNLKFKNIKPVLAAAVVFLTAACSTDDEISSDSLIKNPAEEVNITDTWIRENMTQPYNIEVVYRWDDEETDLSKNLVPPEQGKVIPFLQVLKDLWIDQYEDIAGASFIKSLTPKQILLIGSPNINNDGTVTEGTAEGGRKIILYSVNLFDGTNKGEIKRMIHIVHHEFAHIMHQTEAFDPTFNTITPEGYTATWYNVSPQDALNKGFITPYAQSNTNEDFVEMASNFITSTPQEWDAMIDSAQNEQAREKLREKERIVADYFLQVWNIDLYEFRLQLSASIDALSN